MKLETGNRKLIFHRSDRSDRSDQTDFFIGRIGRIRLIWGICIVIIFLTSTPCFALEGLKIGTKAPNLIGRAMDGTLFRLNKLEAVPKVINFFWVRCVPCKKELPELAEFEKKHPGIKFIAVHTESIDKEKVALFLSGLSGPAPSTIVLAGKRVKELYRFQGLPHTVVLDRNNTVRLALVGYNEENTKKLLEMIKRLE